ncbi:MAG: hypothetical protein CR988_01350 [Treponema sp.]|nr:MAG: hypothetical protein CR988_01350 [Treponema sp.]
MTEKQEDSTITFLPISIPLRVMALIFGAMLLIANLMAFKLSVISVILMSLGVFFVFLGLSDDTWIFNITTEKIHRKKGFLLFPKKTEYNFSEVASIDISEFNRNYKLGTFTEIMLKFKDGRKILIDYDKTKKLNDKIKSAKILQDIFAKQNEKEFNKAFNEFAEQLLDEKPAKPDSTD